MGDLDSFEEPDETLNSFLSSYGVTKEEVLKIKDGDSVKIGDENYSLMKFPIRKDSNDLELALNAAFDLGVRNFVLWGCLGGSRPDHLMVNLLIMVRFAKKGARMVMTDGTNTYVAVKNGEVKLKPFKGHVGVMAYAEKALGVTIEGLSYEAKDIELPAESSLGTSNYFEEGAKKDALIRVDKGTIIVTGNFSPDKLID